MQAGQSLAGKLAEKGKDITNAIPWDELGDAERIERVREYVKMEFKRLEEKHIAQVNKLNKRINELQNHTHDKDGRPVIVERLGAERDEKSVYDSNPFPSPAQTLGGGAYI